MKKETHIMSVDNRPKGVKNQYVEMSRELRAEEDKPGAGKTGRDNLNLAFKCELMLSAHAIFASWLMFQARKLDRANYTKLVPPNELYQTLCKDRSESTSSKREI
ncbi:hypothetical protein L484_013929 [Morus notabilis]|uniref:Uncharacterized protein n=1 Tax=Morus notabilis TaxID=981085 RepID=W9QTY0_9ROSA|nr:hypothetical protein L484_013929 [Morus notabilis]